MTKKRTDDIENFFRMRGLCATLQYETVGRYDYEEIKDKLYDLITNNEDCYIDLTGGTELLLVASGAVASKLNVPLLQFNVRTGNLIRVSNCDLPENEETVSLTNKEMITLNGGALICDNSAWNFSGEFRNDVLYMWDICKENCGLWNKNCNTLEYLERMGKVDDGLCLTVYIPEDGALRLPESDIMEMLASKGIIYDYSLQKDFLTFTFKSSQIRKILTKAGNLLEIYIYMAARDVSKDNDNCYNNIAMSVQVDWDGKTAATGQADTTNEIDVMLMKGTMPVFISCKNGEMHKEALYELDTVANKFGNEFSKKILVSTYMSHDSLSKKYILRRAIDMGIDIIPDINKIDYDKLKSVLKSKI